MPSLLTNLATLLALGSTISSVNAQQPLWGTWSSKSNAVFTGPDFYDPVNEIMHEPSLTGQSISFTQDGFFEQAIYAAIPNPQNPSCPKAMMQFQHGTYVLPDNGSIVLTPFAVDGRQLWSDPCANAKNAVYTRYNQSELYRGYEITIDKYRSQWRLNLYQFDGSPVPPMYLAYSPPQMLPTTTLNPVVTATPSGKSKKRSIDSEPTYGKRSVTQAAIDGADLDRWWYIGVGVTILGGIGYFAV